MAPTSPLSSRHLSHNFVRSAGQKAIPTSTVGAVVAGSIVGTAFLSFLTFYLLRRCKLRRTPRPGNQMAIDETHRSLEEMERESAARKGTLHSPNSSFSTRRSNSNGSHTPKQMLSPGSSPTSSDEGHGSSPFLEPFSPLSPINSTNFVNPAGPDLPLPPIPVPSTRFSFIPAELSYLSNSNSPNPSHARQLSRTHSVVNRMYEEPVQETDSGITFLHNGVLNIAPPGLPPAYFPQPTNPMSSRSRFQETFSPTDAKFRR